MGVVGIGREAFYRNPYPVYARARREPTFLPEVGAWVVGRHADVRQVLHSSGDYSSANALQPDNPASPAVLAELANGVPCTSPSVLTSDGAAHQRLRTPITRALTLTRLSTVVSTVAERAAALTQSFRCERSVELIEAYADRLPGETIGRLLGLDPTEIPLALKGARRINDLFFCPLDPDQQLAAARDIVAMRALLDEHAQRRRKERRDDLCTALVEGLAPGCGDLTLKQRGELTRNLQSLLISGFKTTAALIGTTILQLLRHPDQWELLCAHPELAAAAVEEAVRYDTPAQAFRRVTTCPVSLFGVDLPAGTPVLVALGSANRDPEQHDRAGRFDITRASRRHLSFGYGVHACPGSQLAREQARIAVETLVRTMPGLRLTGPVAMRPTLFHRGPETLELAVR